MALKLITSQLYSETELSKTWNRCQKQVGSIKQYDKQPNWERLAHESFSRSFAKFIIEVDGKLQKLEKRSSISNKVISISKSITFLEQVNEQTRHDRQKDKQKCKVCGRNCH